MLLYISELFSDNSDGYDTEECSERDDGTGETAAEVGPSNPSTGTLYKWCC